MRIVNVIAAAGLVVGINHVAQANPILATEVYSSQGYTAAHSDTAGPVSSTLLLDPNLDPQSFAGVSILGQARANYGSVGVLTSVINGGDMTAVAAWADDFTITGPTAGTHVDFAVGFSVDGTLSVPDDRSGATNPSRAGFQRSLFAADLLGLPGATSPCWASYYAGGGASNCNASASEDVKSSYYLGDRVDYSDVTNGSYPDAFVVSLVVGQTYRVEEDLLARSSISYLAPSSTSANFYNTATFSLTPVGSGYGYTTTSGTDYRAVAGAVDTVPEPGSLLLLGGGLLCVLVARRRLRR